MPLNLPSHVPIFHCSGIKPVNGYVQSISTSQSPPDTTEIAQKIYQIRRSGLEITEIIDLDLTNNNY